MKRLIFSSTLFLLSLNCPAAMDVKPGLWEYQNNIKVNGKEMNPAKEMEKAMAQVPEAQKNMMMAMMKNMGPGGMRMGANFTPQVCVTNEMIEQGNMAPKQKENNCEHKIEKSSGSSVKATFTCKNKSHGEFTVERVSATEIKGEMHSQDEKGNKVDNRFTGKRIAENCKK